MSDVETRCDDCGLLDCACEDDYDRDCSMCGGEGGFFGEECPGFRYGWDDPDAMLSCPSCHGTGAAKDMTIW